MASVKEQQLLRRIDRAERQIKEEIAGTRRDRLRQKKRRLGDLKERLNQLEGDLDSGRVRLCFGSKGLWRKQHHLAENGYSNHQEWLNDWRAARSDEVFVLGSRDETAGCQLCVATVAEVGSLTLRLPGLPGGRAWQVPDH